jgi:hypothetical protein
MGNTMTIRSATYNTYKGENIHEIYSDNYYSGRIFS